MVHTVSSATAACLPRGIHRSLCRAAVHWMTPRGRANPKASTSAHNPRPDAMEPMEPPARAWGSLWARVTGISARGVCGSRSAGARGRARSTTRWPRIKTPAERRPGRRASGRRGGDRRAELRSSWGSSRRLRPLVRMRRVEGGRCDATRHECRDRQARTDRGVRLVMPHEWTVMIQTRSSASVHYGRKEDMEFLARNVDRRDGRVTDGPRERTERESQSLADKVARGLKID
jgi:hypothetical protein